jgi:hypothetical protein
MMRWAQGSSCSVGRCEVECPVRPVAVVVRYEDAEHLFEVPSAED